MAGRQSQKRTRIPIEEYRGFEIWYNEESDKFGCELSEDFGQKERRSLTSLKQLIDEHIKLNLNFKPFKVVNTDVYGCVPRVITIVGIRKDGHLIWEDGERRHFIDPDSSYDSKNTFIFNPEDAIIIQKIKRKEQEREILLGEIKELKKNFTGKNIKEIYGTK